MTAAKTARRIVKGTRKPEWVGRGARGFNSRRSALRLYTVMGSATFLLTALILTPLLNHTDCWYLADHWPFVASLLVLQQVVEFVFAYLIAYASIVWVGEKGIEERLFGVPIRRLSWNQIARVELHRTIGLRCVRVFGPGKRWPTYLSVYFDQTDAVFREAGQWLGASPVSLIAENAETIVCAEAEAITTTPTNAAIEETQETQNAVLNLRV